MVKITFEEYMGITKQLVEKSVALDNMIHTLESSNVSDINWVKDIKHNRNYPLKHFFEFGQFRLKHTARSVEIYDYGAFIRL